MKQRYFSVSKSIVNDCSVPVPEYLAGVLQTSSVVFWMKSRGVMTSYGHYRPLYRAWGIEHWQLKGVVDARGAVNSNYATSPEENTSKASPEDTTSTTEDIQLGEVESRDIYRRSLYVWI